LPLKARASGELPETVEELADPQAGEIRKIHLRAVKHCRDAIQNAIEHAPSHSRDSKVFADLQTISVDLDVLMISRKQSTLFDLIVPVAELLKKYPTGFYADRTYLKDARDRLEQMFPPLIHTMAEYLIENKGVVSGVTMSNFVTVWSTPGFFLETDWDGDEVPMWSTDLFVANPDQVTAILKSRPWQSAQHFLGGDEATAEVFFGGYEICDRPLTKLLKPKYVRDKAALWAKFRELKNWMLQQEANSQIQTPSAP
jgi:hypothetical protein